MGNSQRTPGFSLNSNITWYRGREDFDASFCLDPPGGALTDKGVAAPDRRDSALSSAALSPVSSSAIAASSLASVVSTNVCSEVVVWLAPSPETDRGASMSMLDSSLSTSIAVASEELLRSLLSASLAIASEMAAVMAAVVSVVVLVDNDDAANAAAASRSSVAFSSSSSGGRGVPAVRAIISSMTRSGIGPGEAPMNKDGV